MGPLTHILFAVGIVAADEAGLPAALDAPAAVALLLPLPHLLTVWIRRVSIRGNFAFAQGLARVAGMSSVLVQFGAVTLFGWHRAALRFWDQPALLIDWPDLRLLASLAPFVVAEVLAIDARSRLDGRALELTRTRSFRLRVFAASAFPLLVTFVAASAISREPRLRAYLSHTDLASGAALLVLVVFLATVFPFALRSIWGTTPLAGRGLDGHRHVLDAVAAHAGFRCRELRLWPTGGQVANAAIVGFHPRQRFVFFTDLLLAQLGPRELAAVFAHEIGHARRHHVAVFAAWTIAFFGGVDLVMVELDRHVEASEAVWLAVFGAFFVGWYLVFGYLSRRFELDADLCSVEIAGDPAALVSAFERITGIAHAGRGSWRHFSPRRRIEFLRALALDPGVGHRLRARLRVASGIGLVACLLVGGLQAHRAWTRWPTDRVRAELSLGNYPEAARLADETDGVDARWRELAARAADLTLPVDWGDHVLRAMERGDEQAAQDWIELAGLRGGEELEALRAMLSDPLAGSVTSPGSGSR